MQASQFLNIKTFLSSPIKKTSLSSKKRHRSRPYNKSSKSNTQHIQSIFNRTFISSNHQLNKKQPHKINLQKQSNTQIYDIKSKTQKSLIQLNQYSIIQNKQSFQPQKVYKPNAVSQINYSFVEGVKTRSLTFQYYYKKIKQQKKIKKPQIIQQGQIRNSSINFSKQYATNLNQQMLQCMKKYIKKGQKVAQISTKNVLQIRPKDPNDLKQVQNKSPNVNQLLGIKEAKRYSLSSLLVVKRPRYKTEQNKVQQEGQNSQLSKLNKKSRNRKMTLIQNLLCKRTPKAQIISQKIQPKFDDRTLSNRFQGMIINLNLILNSFKCIISKQNQLVYSDKKQTDKITKKAEKYKYFIGYGNNKNLIRSIMKKRWWWVQVYEIKDANFVWTQLKVNQVIDQIQASNKFGTIISQSKTSKQIKNQSKYFIKTNSPSKNISTKNQQIMITSSEKQTINVQQKDNEKVSSLTQMTESTNALQTLNKSQISIKKKYKPVNNLYVFNLLKKQNQSKLSFVFHQSTPLQTLQIHPKYLNQAPFNFTTINTPKVIHNHYRLNYMFGNKNALFHNLQMYFQFQQKQQDLYKFIPKTYYLQKSNKSGIKSFYQRQFASLTIQQKNSGRKNKNLWIVKPAQNSNRGQGISVHTTFQSIRKQICSSKNSGKFIVQSYLRNLFLYQRRKFDIRAYLLMVTIGQTTKYFWYNQGYIRTSSQYYTTNDIQNIYIHLTNDAIQCDGQKYGKFQPGNKLSYSHFQRYLDTNYPKQKYSMQELNNRMRQIATQAVRAIHPKLKSQKVNHSFELFGLDFLIDSQFKPWLLQINTNPCLQLGCPVLQRLIPRMLQNMFRLSLDSIFQPTQQTSKASSYFIYDNFFQINRFQLIFDSNYDTNQLWQNYCSSIGEEVYADDNQVFQNDGEQVDVNI